MDFPLFRRSAITALIGKQDDDGSWFGDQTSPFSAIEALLTDIFGAEMLYRRSALFHLSPLPGLLPISFSPLMFLSGPVVREKFHDENKDRNIAPVYKAYHFYSRAYHDADKNLWLKVKWLKVFPMTKPDFWIGNLQEFLPWNVVQLISYVISNEEPWLVAQLGSALLFFDVHYQSTSVLESKSYLLQVVENLAGVLANDHWESHTISHVETTAIVSEFIFHPGTLFLLRSCREDLYQRIVNSRESVLRWILNQQMHNGSFDNSPFATCKSISALSVSEYSLQIADIDNSICSGLAYILDEKSLGDWSSLESYQHIEILTRVIAHSSDPRYASMFVGKEITSDIDKPDVFISYGGIDKVFARLLAKDLEENGVRVWIAEWDLDYGESVVKSIESSIERARYFIVILSPEAIERPWVQEEIRTAFYDAVESRRSNVFALMYRQTKMPGFLRGRRWIDFTNADDYQIKMLDLVRRFKGRPLKRV